MQLIMSIYHGTKQMKLDGRGLTDKLYEPFKQAEDMMWP